MKPVPRDPNALRTRVMAAVCDDLLDSGARFNALHYITRGRTGQAEQAPSAPGGEERK